MSEAHKIDMALADMMAQLGVNARRAARQLTTASTDQKNSALQAAADELRADAANILAANADDMKLAEAQNVGAARLDRLMRHDARPEGIGLAL